jgi:hypothetical protein
MKIGKTNPLQPPPLQMKCKKQTMRRLLPSFRRRQKSTLKILALTNWQLLIGMFRLEDPLPQLHSFADLPASCYNRPPSPLFFAAHPMWDEDWENKGHTIFM